MVTHSRSYCLRLKNSCCLFVGVVPLFVTPPTFRAIVVIALVTVTGLVSTNVVDGVFQFFATVWTLRISFFFVSH